MNAWKLAAAVAVVVLSACGADGANGDKAWCASRSC